MDQSISQATSPVPIVNRTTRKAGILTRTVPIGRSPASRSQKKPGGRALADFGALSDAERILLKSARMGDGAKIAETRPVNETPANGVRASFVRFLALGGDERAPVHEHGVALGGAWLIGVLDLDYAEVSRPLVLGNCRIERLDATGATLSSLILHGSKLEKGIRSFNLHCKTSVYLCHGFHAAAPVALIGARIDGDLFCTEGKFETTKEEKYALEWPGLTVGRTLTLPDAPDIAGIDLTDARVAALCDGSLTWNRARGSIKLDGFTYGRLSGDGALEAYRGIRWLDSQLRAHLDTDFRRQPWEQLSSVLRAMGHPAAARKVALTKQKRLRTARKIPFGGRALHKLYGGIVDTAMPRAD